MKRLGAAAMEDEKRTYEKQRAVVGERRKDRMSGRRESWVNAGYCFGDLRIYEKSEAWRKGTATAN